MMKINHPDGKFSGVSYGLQFKNGVATTTSKPLAARLRRLGFAVVDEPTKPEKTPKRGDLEA